MLDKLFGKKKTTNQENQASNEAYGQLIKVEEEICRQHAARDVCLVTEFVSCFSQAAEGTEIHSAGRKVWERISGIMFAKSRSRESGYMIPIAVKDLTETSFVKFQEAHIRVIENACKRGEGDNVSPKPDILLVAPLGFLMQQADYACNIDQMTVLSLRKGQGATALAFWKAVNAMDSYGSLEVDHDNRRVNIRVSFEPPGMRKK